MTNLDAIVAKKDYTLLLRDLDELRLTLAENKKHILTMDERDAIEGAWSAIKALVEWGQSERERALEDAAKVADAQEDAMTAMRIRALKGK